MKDSFSLLLKVGEAMHTTLDLDRRMYIILTCATAGCAFGFSRAFLLLLDKEDKRLEGKMGVGPVSQEDANRIWLTMDRENKSLEDLLAEYENMSGPESMPLFPLVQQLSVPLSRKNELVVQCLTQKELYRIKKASQRNEVGTQFRDILGTEEFVCIPLLVQNEALGVLLADNLYSNRSISEEDAYALAFFANQMAVAIWEARLHEELIKNQNKLREMERKLRRSATFISLGEVAAHLAHEIRNPLVIIGGFARSIHKNVKHNANLEILDKIESKAGTVIKEVERLEKLLSETLDFVHLQRPIFQLRDLNEVVEEICDLIGEELKSKNIKFSRSLSPLPYLRIDQDQMKQMLFNLIQNSIESMPEGGGLEIRSQKEESFAKLEIIDTGEGISPRIREKIFSPFFTTKAHGSGLGLSTVKHIVDEHGGRIEIESEEAGGTSVVIFLPVPGEKGGEGGDVQNFSGGE